MDASSDSSCGVVSHSNGTLLATAWIIARVRSSIRSAASCNPLAEATPGSRSNCQGVVAIFFKASIVQSDSPASQKPWSNDQML